MKGRGEEANSETDLCSCCTLPDGRALRTADSRYALLCTRWPGKKNL